MKARKAAPAPAPGQTVSSRDGELSSIAALAAAAGLQGRGGAEAAAGVLTAVDEDVEGGEEAELPREFDYFSDEEAEE
jgi:26S proteasome regulatory subunit N2